MSDFIFIVAFLISWLGIEFLRWFMDLIYRRDYSKYPVFSLEEIELKKKLSTEYHDKAIKQTKTIDNFIQKSKEKGIIKNIDLSVDIKQRMRKCIDSDIIACTFNRECDAMIEANISALNGEKIKNTKEKVEEVYSGWGWRLNVAEKVYKIWEADKIDSHDWVKSIDNLLRHQVLF